MTEPLDLEGIRKRAEAATPGPWYAKGVGTIEAMHEHTYAATGERTRYRVPIVSVTQYGYNRAPDRDFIAHARTDIHLLIAEVERLRAEAEEASGLIECLDMVRETLAVFLGEEEMKGTAPMFYPEAVRAAMFRAQRGDYKQEPVFTPETPAVESQEVPA